MWRCNIFSWVNKEIENWLSTLLDVHLNRVSDLCVFYPHDRTKSLVKPSANLKRGPNWLELQWSRPAVTNRRGRTNQWMAGGVLFLSRAFYLFYLFYFISWFQCNLLVFLWFTIKPIHCVCFALYFYDSMCWHFLCFPQAWRLLWSFCTMWINRQSNSLIVIFKHRDAGVHGPLIIVNL